VGTNVFVLFDTSNFMYRGFVYAEDAISDFVRGLDRADSVAVYTFDRAHCATPDEPALGVLQRMQTEDINQMPVVADGAIVGMIARDTILHVLQTRLQLGHLTS
jgi:CBS domain-containing protein